MFESLGEFFETGLGSKLAEWIGPGLTKVLGAIVIFFIAWIIAKFIGGIVTRIFKRLPLDEKVSSQGSPKPSKLLGTAVKYIILIMGSMVALEVLGVSQVLEPLNNMMDNFIGAIPNILGAVVIAGIGYYVAKIVSELVSAAGEVLERFATRFNIQNIDLSAILKNLVFIIIFVPIFIAALDYLHMDVITEPIKGMFAQFLSAVPKIILAVIIMAVFYFAGKYLVDLLKGLLVSLGVDDYASKYNLSSILGERKISDLIASIALFIILLIGATTAVGELDFEPLTVMLNDVLVLTTKIIFGVVIFLIGNFLSRLVYNMMSASNNNPVLANIARYAILALFIAIGLRQMGLANEIVELAFGLTLGALAVAFALMFGLGGREAAGDYVKDFFNKLKK